LIFLYINNNLSALDAWRNLVNTESNLSNVIQQLSSGLRINSAADNPSGYAISQQMQTQINGYNQAEQNAQDGISLIQTANGALNQAMAILQNMRQLAVQAASGTTTPADRVDIQNQVDQLAAELTQLSQTTQYNGMNLLDGSFANTPITLQVGANGTANDQLSFTLNSVSAKSLSVSRGTYVSGVSLTTSTAGISTVTTDGTNGDLSIDLSPTGSYALVVGTLAGSTGGNQTFIGLYNGTSLVGSTVVLSGTSTQTVVVGDENAAQAIEVTINPGAVAANTYGLTLAVTTSDTLGLSVVTTTDAQNAINTLSNAIQTISNEQATIGAVQDRLNYTISLLGTASDNITAAQSRITGVDMARETAVFTQDQILLQSGTQMLYQANQIPMAILNLIK
jgi:flagellin